MTMTDAATVVDTSAPKKRTRRTTETANTTTPGRAKKKADAPPAKMSREQLEAQRDFAHRAGRDFMPDTIPAPGSAQAKQELIPGPERFAEVEDQVCWDGVRQIIEQAKPRKAIRLVAELFDVDPATVLFLQYREILRERVKVPVCLFRYGYNLDLSEFIKSLGVATYDGNRTRCWNLVLHDDNRDQLHRRLGDHVEVIVDLESGRVWRNESGASLHVPSTPAFLPLPYGVPVNVSDIVFAIRLARPQDEFNGDFVVHDGKNFITAPGEVFWTELPFLLLRYAVSNGRPRYCAYSTLAGLVDSVGFGNDSRTTTALIARYHDACRKLKKKAFVADPLSLPVEQPGDRKMIQGDFAQFAEDIARVRSRIAGIDFYLLTSDYISMDQAAGADVADHGIEAYIDCHPAQEQYFNRIAEYVGEHPRGYANGHYPIVFSSAALSSFREAGTVSFIEVLVHELAHWFVARDYTARHAAFGEAHGLRWGLYVSILSLVAGIAGNRAGYADEALRGLDNYPFASFAERATDIKMRELALDFVSTRYHFPVEANVIHDFVRGILSHSTEHFKEWFEFYGDS